MADNTMPNFFAMPNTGDNMNNSLNGMIPLLLGATLFGGRGGLFGNNGEGAVAGAATLAAVNQAGHDTSSTILAAQNQAQTMQDVNRIPIYVKDSQAALQHDSAAGFASLNSNVLQGQMAMMSQGANIISAVDSHASGIENQIDRQAAGITNQLNNTNSMIAAGNSANALAAKDAQIAGLQNTQFLASTVTNDGEKTRALLTAAFAELPNAREINLERQLGVAESALMREQLIGTTRSGNVDVITNVNQTATQNNLQAQLQALVGAVTTLAHNQTAMAGNLNILGTQNGITQTPVNVAR